MRIFTLAAGCMWVSGVLSEQDLSGLKDPPPAADTQGQAGSSQRQKSGDSKQLPFRSAYGAGSQLRENEWALFPSNAKGRMYVQAPGPVCVCVCQQTLTVSCVSADAHRVLCVCVCEVSGLSPCPAKPNTAENRRAARARRAEHPRPGLLVAEAKWQTNFISGLALLRLIHRCSGDQSLVNVGIIGKVGFNYVSYYHIM